MEAATIIRSLAATEIDAVADLWYRTGRAAYPYLPNWQALTPELARRVFREHIAGRCDVFVAERDGAIVGYLALVGSYLDRLYVDPPQQGRGVGSALLEHARRLSPLGLELHTHQQNAAARVFYERHGFVAVRFGVSPPPENAPDVEYHWRP
ncbi:MAG TPA: GNAT family N-acetyltransferase [Pseudomonadales bacterium]